ncbi:MAG: cation transporter [Bacteroidales bacterium]|nr:cation transporter [Bacteroidales bacterium]
MSRTDELSRVTISGAVANIALSALKLGAGLAGRSTAMVADAVHSLTDLVSDVIVLLMVHVSSKEHDRGHEYGHGKFETLATAFVAVMLLAVGVKMCVDGMGKVLYVIRGGTLESPGIIALAAALVSIAVKEFLYQWTSRTGKKYDSPSVVANAWHHRTDAFSSVAAALGIGLALLLGGKWTVMDPLVCCGISVFIFVVAFRMGIPALNELTESSLSEGTEAEIKELIASVDGVQDVHALKTRKNGPSTIIDTHIVVNQTLTVKDAHDITVKAEKKLRERFGQSTQISIHVEPDVESD